MPSRKKVILIGWDSADWKIINPLLDAGEMPALQSLIEGGVCGNISTLDPIISPILWTSIATGKHAYKHNILGFAEPNSSKQNLRPTQVTSRTSKALWNILNQNGYVSHVINWWPSHPAEPINGIMVSNLFCKAQFKQDIKEWKVEDGSIHPNHLTSQLAAFRVHPRELTQAHILPFIPNAHLIDQEEDASIANLACQIAESATIQNIATYILDEDKDWNFMGVYFEAPDLVSHQFMKYHPPKLAKVKQEKYELYHQVVSCIYKFHDMMLARLLELLDEDTTVILTSDHGFYSDQNRILAFPKEPAAIAKEHRPLGVFVAKGPNIKKDERIYGASILDITPTILSIFGLPIGLDMDGKPLLNIFENPISVQKIASWEDIAGDDGQHNGSNFKEDFKIDQTLLEQLSDLGYIDSLENSDQDNTSDIVQKNIFESKFYKARSYLSDNKSDIAVEILEELCSNLPAPERYLNYLMIAYLNLNQVGKVEKLLSEHAIKILPVNKLLIEAELLSRKKCYDDAISKLSEANKFEKNNYKISYALGNAYYQKKEYLNAIKLYDEALFFEPEQHKVYYQKGLSLLALNHLPEALDSFLDAVGLMYYDANFHYYIGYTLYLLKQNEAAAQAFEVCLRIAPNHRMALLLIEKLYKDILNTPEKYDALFIQGGDNLPLVYIVSGLPRSGTSMMMQILEAAGLEIYKDDIRQADVNNPKGYFEHEAVKQLHKDKAWLVNAENKVLKVVTPLIPNLPNFMRYKIIFIERNIDEVISSQNKMLQNMGKLPKNSGVYLLKEKFLKLKNDVDNYLTKSKNIEFIVVNHQDIINCDETTLKKMSHFFNIEVSNNLVKQVVDIKLHRTKFEIK